MDEEIPLAFADPSTLDRETAADYIQMLRLALFEQGTDFPENDQEIIAKYHEQIEKLKQRIAELDAA